MCYAKKEAQTHKQFNQSDSNSGSDTGDTMTTTIGSYLGHLTHICMCPNILLGPLFVDGSGYIPRQFYDSLLIQTAGRAPTISDTDTDKPECVCAYVHVSSSRHCLQATHFPLSPSLSVSFPRVTSQAKNVHDHDRSAVGRRRVARNKTASVGTQTRKRLLICAPRLGTDNKSNI